MGSQDWKKMLQARDLVDHQILCKIRGGGSSIYYDNWNAVDDLYNMIQQSMVWDNNIQVVKDLIQEGNWNEHLMLQIFP